MHIIIIIYLQHIILHRSAHNINLLASAVVLSKAAGILINFSLKSMEMFSLIQIELFQMKASSCPYSFADVYPDISLT